MGKNFGIAHIGSKEYLLSHFLSVGRVAEYSQPQLGNRGAMSLESCGKNEVVGLHIVSIARTPNPSAFLPISGTNLGCAGTGQ